MLRGPSLIGGAVHRSTRCPGRRRAWVKDGLCVVTALLAVSCSASARTQPRSAGNTDNGEQMKTGPAVAADAADAMVRSGSVEVRFDEPTDLGALRLQTEDEAGGTVGPPDGYARVTSVDGRLFISAPPAYWRSLGMSPARAARLGYWTTVRLPISATRDPAFHWFGLQKAADFLRRPKGSNYRQAVTSVVVDGRPVVRVEATDGSVLFVENRGDPRPVRITGPWAAPASAVDFDDYGNFGTIPTPQTFIDAAPRG